MSTANVVAWILTICFSAVVHGSLMIPGTMISPLGVPSAMGPSGMNAVKLAVGTRLINMLGSLGIGSPGGLSGNILGSPMNRFGDGIQDYPDIFPGNNRFSQITPKSKDFAKRRGPNIPTSFNIKEASSTEIENFFGVLHRVDANKCISRLVCEIGGDPKVIEGLGHNVKEVVSSLRILEKNTLSTKYRQIMLEGQEKGLEACAPLYSTCDPKSYRLVRTFVRAFRVKRS